MAELTLKDESVIDIGNALGERVSALTSTSNALVPVGGAGVGAIAQPMSPVDSMRAIFEDIRDGIYQLVDKFSDGVALQKQEMAMDEQQQDLAAVGATEELKEDTGPTMGDRFREKMEQAGPALSAAGFLAGFLLLAATLKKYKTQIAETITPFVDGISGFLDSVSNFGTTLKEEAKRFAELTPEGGFLALPIAGYTIFTVFQRMKLGVLGFFNGLNARFASVITTIQKSKIGSTLTSFVKTLGSIGSTIGGIFRGMANFVLNNPIVKTLTKLFGNILRFFGPLGLVVQAVIGIFSSIKGAIDGFKTGGILGAITGAITGLFDGLVGSVLNLITGGLSWIADKLGLTFISDFLSKLDFRSASLITFFTETLPGYLTDIKDNLIQKFKDIVSGMKEKVGEFKDKIFTGIKNFLIMLKDKITAPFVGIVNAVKGAAAGLVDKIPLISDERKASIKEKLGLTSTVETAEDGNNYQMDANGNIIDKDGNQMIVDEKTGEFIKAPVETATDNLVTTEKRTDGTQMNNDSAELASGDKSGDANLQVVKGGDSVQSQNSNNYLIAEKTGTSDWHMYRRYLNS